MMNEPTISPVCHVRRVPNGSNGWHYEVYRWVGDQRHVYGVFRAERDAVALATALTAKEESR
jgi:hypothetical protein